MVLSSVHLARRHLCTIVGIQTNHFCRSGRQTTHEDFTVVQSWCTAHGLGTNHVWPGHIHQSSSMVFLCVQCGALFFLRERHCLGTGWLQFWQRGWLFSWSMDDQCLERVTSRFVLDLMDVVYRGLWVGAGVFAVHRDCESTQRRGPCTRTGQWQRICCRSSTWFVGIETTPAKSLP